jgi:long-chain acyl-CoA synthetase
MVQQWIDGGAVASKSESVSTGESLEEIVARYTHGRPVASGATLDELGLSSLERVELMMAIEQRFGASVDEGQFSAAGTVGDIRAALDRPSQPQEPLVFPSWNRGAAARLIRIVSLATWILPIARLFLWVRAEGRKRLASLSGPVIFAANHQSHLDTPAIFLALPWKWRRRLAPAMAKEFFKAHFFPAEYGRWKWFTNSLNYYLSALFFNAFPIPQRETGIRETLRYAGDLVSEGACILIYPEGKRSVTGEIDTFRSGVGILASKLEIPVVPIRIEEIMKVLPLGWKMARPGKVRVKFGNPLTLQGEDYAGLARQVEEAIRKL